MFYMTATSIIDVGHDTADPDKVFQTYSIDMLGNRSTMFYAIQMLKQRAMSAVSTEWLIRQLERLGNTLHYDSVFLYGYRGDPFTVTYNTEGPDGPTLKLTTHEPIEVQTDLQEYPVVNDVCIRYNERVIAIDTLRGDKLHREWVRCMMNHIQNTHHIRGPRGTLELGEFFSDNKTTELMVPGKGLLKQINIGGVKRRYEYHPDQH